MNKLFKFWKWRIELKISKLSNQKRVEFLTIELLKELHTDFSEDCNYIPIFTHKSSKVIDIKRNDDERIIFNFEGEK